MSAAWARGAMASVWTVLVAPAMAADLTGVWQAVAPAAALRTEQGQVPPLLPEAKQTYEQHLAARKTGKAADFDGTLHCQPPGIPRAYLMGMPFEIQQEDKFVYFLFQWNRLIRVVDLDVTHEQQSQFAPYYFGWSVGRWQQNVLTTDVVLFEDSTVLDAAGLPHSMDLHLTERWTLSADGKSLEARITFEDPAMYSAPWSTRVRFKRAPAGTEIREDVCLERLGIVKPK